ncbi:MAG: 3-oxoacid CoA-transferase subunit A [Sporomusaceae bacterium]|nr:3-oxoacid CoA-transferase subunit A [Sporomusaceae bacterium]
MNKVTDLDQVIDKVQDGMTLLFGGFCGVGAPLTCIQKIADKGVKNLTIMSVVATYPGGKFDLAPLFSNGQVKKFICAHAGTSPEAVSALKNGNLDIEYYPMGSWIEKVRAGGAGLGGVLTRTGLGSLVEEGKEKIVVDGKEYILEKPLRADMAFIKGYKADLWGNVQYRYAAINTNPTVAMAADYTVAEVNEIVPVGKLDPQCVGTPAVFVHAVVQGKTLEEQATTFRDLWSRTGQLR